MRGDDDFRATQIGIDAWRHHLLQHAHLVDQRLRAALQQVRVRSGQHHADGATRTATGASAVLVGKVEPRVRYFLQDRGQIALEPDRTAQMVGVEQVVPVRVQLDIEMRAAFGDIL